DARGRRGERHDRLQDRDGAGRARAARGQHPQDNGHRTVLMMEHSMSSPRLRARRGFSLPEMIISMTLMLTVIGLSTKLFRKQSEAVSVQAGRLDAQQNSRFAL